MKKRIASVLLLVLVLLAAIGVLAACNESETLSDTAPEPTPVDYFTFEPNSARDGYILTGTQKILPADVVIPSEYMGMPVTEIGESAFEGCTEIESVVIPSTVSVLLPSAFARCSCLESVLWQENNIQNFMLSCDFRTHDFPEQWIYEAMTNPTSSRLDLYTDAKGWFDTIRDFSDFSCDASDIIAYQQATFNGAFENCKSLKKADLPKSIYIFAGSFYGCNSLRL